MKLNCLSTRAVFLVAALHVLRLIGHGAEGDTWVRKTDMPTPRIGLSTCALNGKIYAIGGYQQAGGSGMSAFEEYDPATDSWAVRPSMPTPRLGTASEAVNGKIYVIGGATVVGSPLNIVEEFNPATATWVRKAKLDTFSLLRAAHSIGRAQSVPPIGIFSITLMTSASLMRGDTVRG